MFICRQEKAWYWVWVSPENAGMLESAENNLDIATEQVDLMSVKVARKMTAWANEKLKSAVKYRLHHLKVRSDIGSKQ